MTRRAGPSPGSSKARERVEDAIDAAQGELTRTRLAAYCDADPRARERLLASVAALERQVDALWARLTPRSGGAAKTRKARRTRARQAAVAAPCRRAKPKRPGPHQPRQPQLG
jgi:hypothetical protein